MVKRLQEYEELLAMIEFDWPRVSVNTQLSRDHYVKWCENNIGHKFGTIGNTILFEKESDMILFVLRWSNEITGVENV